MLDTFINKRSEIIKLNIFFIVINFNNMCSSAGDIEDISNCPKEIPNNIHKELFKKCKKCPEKSTILLQKKDPFCKTCFLEYSNHKFRSTIGKSKKIKHGEKVLIACSGGRKSAALLHMTFQTLKSASLKQISFTPSILFIDESFITNSTSADSNPDIPLILKHLHGTNYPVFFSSLEMVHKINIKEDLYSSVLDDFSTNVFSSNQELKLKMNETFKAMPLSSRVDLLKHLRLLLITEIASQTGCNYVFLGDTASSLAVELLSDIALGRGSQISSDTSFYDARYRTPICRPLREFLNKEIALYNHLHHTVYDVYPDFLTKTSANSCIQRLTETFLSNLQENFPATIFTVFRTGGKLSKNDVDFGGKKCIVCKSELDNINPDPCSALEALKISQKLSSASGTLEKKDSIDIFQFLCHGCSISFQNVNSPEHFDSLIPQVSLVQMERDKMKEEIEDFFIENESDDC